MSEGVNMTAPAATSNRQLQNTLQRAVQTVQWTYTIYWRLCSLQRILVWSDGYYNGAIKTRKTVQPKEVSAEEASLQRSQQLRELYEMLCAGETNHQTKRPSAALSPEDLTESEWFYLMCFSYCFPPGIGLPGRAYAKRQHVWLTGANEEDSQFFSRAILAKQSAQIQTVVCIPLLDGVVEVGTTERVEEDVGFIQNISNLFILNHHDEPQFMHLPTKPALSEHSTSNPPGYTTSPPAYITINPQLITEEEEEEEVAYGDSDTVLDAITSDHVMIHNPNSSIPQSQTQSSSDLMQLDISSEDIRSPDDGSNNMDSDYQHILPTPTSLQIGRNQDTNEFEELGRRQYGDHHQDPQFHIFHAPLSPSGRVSSFNELPMQEDTHYSQTVAAVLQLQLSNRWCSDISISSATTYKIHHLSHSAFFKWSYSGSCSASNYLASSSQKKLKYILFTLPFLYNSKDLTTTTFTPASREEFTGANHVLAFTPASREELTGANHVLAERRRREKLNERFIILRSLVPFVTKMDKASILGDTIEYVKQLRNKIQELEEAQANAKENVIIEVKEPKGCEEINIEKKMMRRERGKLKAGGSHQPVDQSVHVEVSIIEKDALVEMQCPHREGLLLDVMQMLRQLRLEITAVQSSLSNGLFVADLRAKVKENLKGKKATIMEVKKALHQTVSLPKQRK